MLSLERKVEIIQFMAKYGTKNRRKTMDMTFAYMQPDIFNVDGSMRTSSVGAYEFVSSAYRLLFEGGK